MEIDFTAWKAVFQKMQDGMRVIDVPEEARPSCPMCEDTGYIRLNIADIHDPRFGKLYPCPEPNCPARLRNARQQAESVMRFSSWNDSYYGLTFDSFKQLMSDANVRNGKRGAYAAAFAFAHCDQQPFTLTQAAQYAIGQNWPGDDGRVSNSVVLTGDVGLGKTGLAVAAANALLHRAKPVIFIRVLTLIDYIRETYKPNWDGESAQDRINRLSSVPYLVLDEFGIKAYTDNRLENVEQIIRGRDRAGLPTLITTNLNLQQVYELWEPQIADIVAKYHWVTMGGAKLRQTAQKAADAW